MNFLPPPQTTWCDVDPDRIIYWVRFLYTDFTLELEDDVWVLTCESWGGKFIHPLDRFCEPDIEEAKRKAMHRVLSRLRTELHNIEESQPAAAGISVWDQLLADD